MHEPPPHTGAYDCVNAHEPPPHSGAKHRVNVQRPPGHDVGVSQSSNAHSPVLHGVASQSVAIGRLTTRAAVGLGPKPMPWRLRLHVNSRVEECAAEFLETLECAPLPSDPAFRRDVPI